MGLRLRALILLVVVALTASGATAWLTLREADRQVRDSAAAEQGDIQHVTEELRGFALRTGSWDGVDALVAQVAADTGERVRVVSPIDGVLADSDVLAGQPARPVELPPVAVDATPVLALPPDATATDNAAETLSAVARFRADRGYAACVERAGRAVGWSVDALGVPTVVDPAVGEVPGCGRRGAGYASSHVRTLASVCDTSACFQRFFRQDVVDLVPDAVAVYIGGEESIALDVSLAPVLLVVAVVALVIVAGAVLFSRRVMRPVTRLSEAATEFGSGRLGARVPVVGRDELAELSRSFNAMAASLQDADDRQRRLIGDVSHELRTPMANLRGYLEAIRDGVLEPTPELVASLHEEVMHQLRLVDDLHELALAEAGALTYHWATTDVGDVAHSCRTAMLPAAEAAGLRLVVDVTAQPTSCIAGRADSDRLRQVLTNIVGNAIAATPAGGEITVSVRSNSREVLVDVSDTGAGIRPADLPYVFDRLWRADEARSRGGGSGLGLAVTRQIVHDHDGTITVRSTPGAGSVFTVRLPRWS